MDTTLPKASIAIDLLYDFIMLIAAHQPNYLPNLSFFHKMKRADVFIVITNIQFEKHEGWQQRHKVSGTNGDTWLTVPVFGSQNQLIKDVKINNFLPWKRKHKKTLEILYGRTTKEKKFLKSLLELYDRDWNRLVDLNFSIILLIKKFLSIETPVILDEEVSGRKHDFL